MANRKQMVTETEPSAEPRTPLSKERVLRAAVKVADEDDIDSLTMRNLAEELGVEAMSLCYHVANKEAVLDGVLDAIMTEIERALGGFRVPSDRTDWKTALLRRILTARRVMLRHPWAPSLFESRTTMSPTLVFFGP